ncbi:MAG: divergent PAP2 family protein [Fusobacterium sp. JB021]|nr:divergent PAP2 family protein [Fusobacterium sp. JB020]MDP0493676.1 divergent PAP2 family protein [Fusobacterium sp. JB021]MDP0506409.1 divergent PAP2 family protein [Fusobacterium sp. JB019]
MDEYGIIFGNKILDVTFIAWFIAQFYKVIATIFVDKAFNLKRFYETGGMPSSHSSTVSCLATCVGIVYGTRDPLFSITLVFAGIIMYDAAGIRRAAGKQARVVNKMVDGLSFKIGEKFNDEKLKELLGHTPIEVFVGMILGVGVALLFKSYLIP